MLSILFYAILLRGCFPIGLETADRIHIVRLNDSVFDLDIGGCLARTERSRALDDFLFKITQGMNVQPPDIYFAVRVGYPRISLGFFFVKVGEEYLLTRRQQIHH